MKNKYHVIMPNTFSFFHNMLYKTCWIDAREETLKLFDYNPQAKVIDLGCNVGEITIRVADKIGADNIIGTDIRRPEKLVDDKIKFLRCDLNEVLSFQNNTFDVINATNIIEHLYYTDLFLSEINRILKPNGYVVISTCNMSSWHNIVFLLLGKQPPAADVSDIYSVGFFDSPKKKEDIGPQHRRLFTIKAMTDLLKCYGFKIEKTVGIGFYPFSGKLAKLFAYIDKNHSAYFAVKARKI